MRVLGGRNLFLPCSRGTSDDNVETVGNSTIRRCMHICVIVGTKS